MTTHEMIMNMSGADARSIATPTHNDSIYNQIKDALASDFNTTPNNISFDFDPDNGNAFNVGYIQVDNASFNFEDFDYSNFNEEFYVDSYNEYDDPTTTYYNLDFTNLEQRDDNSWLLVTRIERSR